MPEAAVETPVQTPAPVAEAKPTLVERAHLDEVIKDRDIVKHKYRELEAEVQKYRTAEAERQAKEAKSAEEAQQAELVKRQEYEKALQVNNQRHEEKFKKLQEAATKKYVPAAIKSAASKIEGLTPEALDDLPILLRDRIRTDPETLESYVVDEKGDVLKGKIDGLETLAPVSVDDFVNQYVQGKKYMFRDTLPKGTGSKPVSSSKKEFTIENAIADPKLDAEWQKVDKAGYDKAVKKWASQASQRARAGASSQVDANNVVRALKRS